MSHMMFSISYSHYHQENMNANCSYKFPLRSTWLGSSYEAWGMWDTRINYSLSCGKNMTYMWSKDNYLAVARKLKIFSIPVVYCTMRMLSVLFAVSEMKWYCHSRRYFSHICDAFWGWTHIEQVVRELG